MSDQLTDKFWRLNHLYKVVNKEGKLVTFQFNDEQQYIWDSCFDNLGRLVCSPDVLKARQLGITTFFAINYFDDCIFHNNLTCYIQSHDQESIKKIFRIVKTAYNNLREELKPDLDRGGGSQYEYYFPERNSRIYVGLENRSNTVHRLHISETAFQDKSRITATLGSLPPGVFYSRETTPNGVNWYFEDYFSTDVKTRKKMFFPWYTHKSYQLTDMIDYYTVKEQKYVDRVKNKSGVELTKEQMSFRRQKVADLLSDQAFDQEYPADEETCFMVGDINRLVLPEASENEFLIREVTRPKCFKSYVFIDLGLKDSTAMLFGYHHFDLGALVIEDELIVSYWTTKQKADEARNIEGVLGYTNPKRISDNDQQQLFDFNKDHGYKIDAVSKRSKQPNVNYRESIINGVRIGIRTNKVIISPRCKNLIFQVTYGMWNEQRTDFERNYDLKGLGIVMGHLDGLMALAYGYDNTDWGHNPYPEIREETLNRLDWLSRLEAEADRKIRTPDKKHAIKKFLRY